MKDEYVRNVAGGQEEALCSPTKLSASGVAVCPSVLAERCSTVHPNKDDVALNFQPEVFYGADNIGSAAVPARKRGKCMSRRSGRNPKVRVGKRADGTKYFYFQYWVDVPGQEERQRKTEVLGLCSQMTKSEAERKKLEFISNLKLNSGEYKIPSSRSFANAVKHYREIFAPRMLRESTFSIADGHIRKHLEADWNDVPVERITIDAVNEWSWKKRHRVFRG